MIQMLTRKNDMEHCDVEYPNDDDIGEDGSIVIAPSWDDDGPQASCALLPCEIRWVIL